MLLRMPKWTQHKSTAILKIVLGVLLAFVELIRTITGCHHWRAHKLSGLMSGVAFYTCSVCGLS